MKSILHRLHEGLPRPLKTLVKALAITLTSVIFVGAALFCVGWLLHLLLSTVIVVGSFFYFFWLTVGTVAFLVATLVTWTAFESG